VKSIYKSEAGRERVLAAYDDATDRLEPPIREHRTLETRFGDTHVLVSGPEDAAPVIFFHGGNSFNADTLAWFPDVIGQFRVYGPDTIGHPGRSAETRLSPTDLSYGEWAADVMTSLDLDHAAALGVSYGAGIVMRLATVAPRRLDKVALVVPSGLVKPKMMSMMRMVVPWLQHTVSPSRQSVVRMLQPLFADTPADDEAVDTFSVIFENVRIERGLPRPTDAHELGDLDAPVLVIAAELDVLFPASLVIPRAQEIIPNLYAAEQISGSGHYPSPEDRQSISKRVTEFLN
jgi:pimeloyl-ACP methyl ester carboxylesterase